MVKKKLNNEGSKRINSLIEYQKAISDSKSRIKTIESAIENEQNKRNSIMKTEPLPLPQTREDVLAQIAMGELEKEAILEFEKKCEIQNIALTKFEKQLSIINDTLKGLSGRLELEKKHLQEKENEARELFLIMIEDCLNRIGEKYYYNLIALMDNYDKLYYYTGLMKRLGRIHCRKQKENNPEIECNETCYNKELIPKSNNQIKAPMFKIHAFKQLIELRKTSYFPEPGCFTDYLYRIVYKEDKEKYYNEVKNDFASQGLDLDYYISLF